MRQLPLEEIVDIVRDVYELKEIVGNSLIVPVQDIRVWRFSDDKHIHEKHRAVLIHTYLIANKVEGYSLEKIRLKMGGTRGTICKLIQTLWDEIERKDGDARKKHLQILRNIKQEDYFTGTEAQEDSGEKEETPIEESDAPESPIDEPVGNPLFAPVIDQKTKVVPSVVPAMPPPSIFGGKTSALPDDGVPVPDLKNLGKNLPIDAPDAPEPADEPAQEATIANTTAGGVNTADFVLGLMKILMVPASGYFTHVDAEEIERAEERGRFKKGTAKRVERLNEKNQKKLETEIGEQLNNMRPALARATSSTGTHTNPFIELAFTAAVAVGMIILAIVSARANTQAFLQELRRESREV